MARLNEEFVTLKVRVGWGNVKKLGYPEEKYFSFRAVSIFA